MAATWKTVRVFISSTFRDMHAERDYLVKVVFPALRERLEKYRIHLVDIDLRWGITEEEAQHDRVLDLCLEQIDDCRPLFVGILGERYGWVPDSFSEEAASKYGWVQHQTGKSVTELEILYGVLRDPKMVGRGLFYFRDPAFIAALPEARQGDFLPENAPSREKLASLKEAICQADLPHPPLEDYPCRYAGLRLRRLTQQHLPEADREALGRMAEDGLIDPDKYCSLSPHLRAVAEQCGTVVLDGLEVLGRRVEQGLWEAIRREHNLPEVPTVEADEDPLAEEAAYHEAFIVSRLRVYVGREDVQKQLVEFADSEATVPCLVTGPSGTGKSAAMARFVHDYAIGHPDVFVIPHFVGASPDSSSLRHTLRRFCLVLQQRFGLADEAPQDVGALVGRFRWSIEQVPADARVILLVDALNQLDETDNAHSLYWLPWQLPPQVKIIVSCIDDVGWVSDPSRQDDGSESPGQDQDELEARPTDAVLDALAHRPVTRVRIGPLTAADRFEIVTRVPSLSAKKLSPSEIGLLLSNPATANPLFLLVALEELRGFGSFEQLNARIEAFPREGDAVTAIFDQVIERLRGEFDPDVVLSILCPLAASRHGMSQLELLEMTEGIGVEESTSDLFPILRQLRPYLQYRGDLIDFFHSSLETAVRQRYLPDAESERSWHVELARYFRAKLNPPRADAWSGDYIRALSELPHHQTHGEMWPELEATLMALPFLEAKNSAGLVFELAGDFSAAVEALPEERPQRRILRLLEEALRRDIHFIARHAKDYPQGLFQCLWNYGWWYDCPEAAKHYLPSSASERAARGENGPWSQPGMKLYGLLEGWRESKERRSPGFTWVGARRPPPVHLGTAQLAVLRGHEEGVTSVSYSPDGRRIVSGSEDKTIRVWDAQSGAELAVWRGHEDTVTSVSYSPDGRRIASGSKDKTVRVWDAQSGNHLGTSRGHEGEVTSVSYSPDGRRIVSSSFDGTVRVWGAQSGDELAVLRGWLNWLKGTSWFRSASYSPDGREIVGGANDKTVRVWDAQSGREFGVLRGHEDAVTTVSCSPDGRWIVSGSGDHGHDHSIRVWDRRSPRMFMSGWGQGGDDVVVLRGHEDTVTSVCYSPDGERIASGSFDGTVRLWEAQSGAELAVLRGHESNVLNVSYSPDGRRIASGSHDGTVRVWDAQSRAALAVLRGHGGWRIDSVSYSPDGTRIASGGDQRDKTIRLWDASSGTELAVLSAHEDSVISVAYSPDGQDITSSSRDKTVRVWDIESGAVKVVIRARILPALQRAGATMAQGGLASLLRPHWQFASTESVSYSPDGRKIVSGGGYGDSTVRVWDAQTSAEVSVFTGHEASVNCVSYCPDGRRIASGSLDKTVRVWDAQSGAQLHVLRGHEGAVIGVSFSPDGRWIASSSWDTTVRVWDAQSGECLEVIPFRALTYRSETVIERADSGQRIGRFPVSLEHLVTQPSGRAWAGASVNQLYIVELEGGPALPADRSPTAQVATRAARPVISHPEEWVTVYFGRTDVAPERTREFAQILRNDSLLDENDFHRFVVEHRTELGDLQIYRDGRLVVYCADGTDREFQITPETAARLIAI